MTVKKIIRLALLTLVALVLLFGLIQLIPLGKDHVNPPVLAEPNWDSPQTLALVRRSCFDCHSNETVWPWYSNIAPVSWLVYRDTINGREHLNFSEWGRGNQEGLDELAQTIESGEMPPFIYIIQHPNAKLSPAEKQALITGLQASLR
ncbi:MAG: heme-binding domain-containing protein [Chloroflexi bacterium]|nr:heme-binding domain-containing protein [Chloroflexota bacterium]